MKILVTNDDGPQNPSLYSMLEYLEERGHEAVAIVPERPRSAAGMARTYHKPLRVWKADRVYLINGYPSDAVFMGLKLLAPDAQMVISGVNSGENVGVESTFGSGTVGAALQAGALGVRAIAMSMERGGDLSVALKIAGALTSLAIDWPRDLIALSVNIPAEWSGEVVSPRKLAKRVFDERVYTGEDPRGVKFFWRWGPRLDTFEEDTDAYYFYVRRAVTIVGIGVSGVGGAEEIATAISRALKDL